LSKFTKTEFIYIQGKVSWFRPKVPNKWNKWSVQIHPDAKGLELIRDLQAQGVKNQLKKDDDGYYTNFSRPVTKETVSGRILSFTPVEVFDADGKPFDEPVGNGSDVTLKLEVYGHNTPAGGTAKAIRWQSARIDNLVPFNNERDLNTFEKEAASGLVEQPKQEQLF
jgi:hypothetical protein